MLSVVIGCCFAGSVTGIAVVMLLYWFGAMGNTTTTVTVSGLSAFGTVTGAIGTVLAVIVAIWLAGTSSRNEHDLRRRMDIGALVALRGELQYVHVAYTAEIIEVYDLPIWHDVYKEIGALDKNLTELLVMVTGAVLTTNRQIQGNRRFYEDRAPQLTLEQRVQLEHQQNVRIREDFIRPTRKSVAEAIERIDLTIVRLREEQ